MLYASQHQIAPQGRKPVTLSITASGRNVNLRTLADAAGYNGTSPAAVTVTVVAGVIIGSTSTTAYALDTGTWPTGTTLQLIIGSGAYVVGKGGDGGGNGGGLDLGGAPGSPGGPALCLRIPTTISNTGIIAGGGGGGGGANDGIGGVDSPFGGGGAGDLPGNAGKAWAGTLTTGGIAHRDASGGDGTPGNGGALGSDGKTGGRVGGTAGIAITGGAYATYATTGTIIGSILS